MESLFWGRMDWQDRTMRYNKQQGTNGFEWIWQGSRSLGKSAQIFAGNLFGTGGGGYASWFSFDGAGAQVNDDPAREDYNVDQWVDKFVQNALNQANHTLTEHQLWALGSDFQYQNADHWYRNLDKLIHYVNLNGTVNAFYSTPSIYVDEKKKWSGSYEVRADDIFPLADNSHNYWSGYFTSRPALKRQVRFATNVLDSARQLEILTRTTAAEVNMPLEKHSPPVGRSWTDSFEGTVGVATHHDGMSGTERQDVTDDYEMRISTAQKEVEAGVALSLAKLLGDPTTPLSHCHCHAQNDCLNISVCAATTEKDAFTIAAWNPRAHAATDVIRLPVSGAAWHLTDATGRTIPSQTVPLDERTLSLPQLYLNSYGLNASQAAAARAALANKADHLLLAAVPMPPLGLATFRATKSAADGASVAAATEVDAAAEAGMTTVENDMYSLSFDASTGLLSSITNKRSNVSTPLSISWGWYNSSVGGCTSYPSDVPKSRQLPPCSNQKSGAYIFRPNSSTLFYPGPAQKPTIEVVRGPMVTEVRQTFSAWATHVIRLFANTSHVELEWTAGPIPIDTPWEPPVAFDKKGAALPNNWGKEVVLKYASGLSASNTWYTDSNGKEMLKRVYNARGPTYPHVYNISEPVAGNYYPVNAMMSLDDGAHELAVLTDVSQAGASLQDGALEFMLHRRIQADDSRGVQEPLNETMCGCNDINAEPGQMGQHGHEGDGGCVCAGLTMRGRHLLIFDTLENVRAERRRLSEALNFPPLLGFTDAPPPKTAPTSFLNAALPPNVKLVTLTNNYADFHQGKLLLRLSHLYAVGEHPTLSLPVDVDLSTVFAKEGLRISGAEETTVTGSKQLAAGSTGGHVWTTHAATPAAAAEMAKIDAHAYAARVPFTYPKLTLRPMEVRTFLATFA